MSCDQALGKLSGKPNSRLLVQEEHGFKNGWHNVPSPWPQEQKEKHGLDRVNTNHTLMLAYNVFRVEKALHGTWYR